MALVMRDSTNPFDIPLAGLAAVAGYGDGQYTWSSEGWARFPPPIVPLSIVVNAHDAGDILDVENGDADPGECPGWADRFNRAGRRRPTIYCNRSTIGAVRQAMGSRPFDWWAATLDGTTDGTAGAVAVQLYGEAQTGGHYDESVIVDPSWIGASSSLPAPGLVWTPPLPDYVVDHVQDADLVVVLASTCHAPVFESAGAWLRGGAWIATPQVGQFAEWKIAKRVGGAWWDLDESGGPSGTPTGFLPPDQSFWITDASVDTTGCGGTDPVAVAHHQGAGVFTLGPPPAPAPAPPPPAPTPPPAQPDLAAAGKALDAAEQAIKDARTALGL